MLNKKIKFYLFKRGNISFFIIIGILMLAVVILLFALTNGIKFNSNSQFKEVNNYVEYCYDEATASALVYVSKQGGIFLINNLDGNELLNYKNNTLEDFSPPDISILNSLNLNKEPIINKKINKNDIEEDISSATKLLLYNCLNNFSDFSHFSPNNNEVKMNVSTSIEKTAVIIRIDYPVEFKTSSGNHISRMNLSPDERIFYVHLHDVIKLSNTIINNKKAIFNSPEENNNYEFLNPKIYYFDNYLLFIIEDSAKLNDKSFKFAFATDNKKN